MWTSDIINRFRLAAELMTEPALAPYKFADVDKLSAEARQLLWRRCRRLLDGMWEAVESATGIKRHQTFCVVFHTNTYCTVVLTPDASVAAKVALEWPGQTACVALVGNDSTTLFSPFDASEGKTFPCPAETWLALTVSLSYKVPTWLHAI